MTHQPNAAASSRKERGPNMATFVLVHGAWHGGWCWKKVTPMLRAAGHEVFTPTLTGLGERAHLLGPNVTLATHIADVVNLLVYEDLTDVLLVGHSYGGMVIAGVSERVPERLRRLLYLDAALPDDGQSFFDVYPDLRKRWVEDAREMNGTRVYMLPMSDWLTERWRITDPDDVAWMLSRLTPQPLRAEEESSHLPLNSAAQLPSSFIRCAGFPDQPITPGVNATKAQARGFDYREIETGHIAMVTASRELATHLIEIAGKSAVHVVNNAE